MAKDDKLKALDAAIAQIERQYGKGSVMKLGDNSANMNVETVPTGSLSLDIALGLGGLPKGRIIEIYGPESSGKTTVALHWDSDGLSYDKGCFYASVPKQLKNRKPVASYWKEHDALGKALIKGLRSKKVKISGTGAAEIDLTQTSYSTIPSVDIELGNQCSDHSDKKMEKLADGLLRGINSYAKKYIHVAPLSSL